MKQSPHIDGEKAPEAGVSHLIPLRVVDVSPKPLDQRRRGPS